MQKISLLLSAFAFVAIGHSQNIQNNPKSNHANKLEQLGTILPDANTYRTGSGAPGSEYWQQKADYDITGFLNEKELMFEGSEQITYYNNSPDNLIYLWLQLDENQHDPNLESNNENPTKLEPPITNVQLERLDFKKNLEGMGFKILSITDFEKQTLKNTINNSMMRIDLAQPLKSKQKIVFNIKWKFKIPNRLTLGGRGGYEMVGDEQQPIFTMSQWYPRMCVYNDYQGWNNKQFTGGAEFALVFGNYKVKMKVPSDHIIAATGVCTNYAEMLTPGQLAKWQQAQNSSTPVEIVTLDEAIKKEKSPIKDTYKTWQYSADNVRDFAWGSSRKFVWDAMGVKIEGKNVMCMSYYAKEAYGLYHRYSTKVVAHTIKTYSKYTIPYPYPSAISVEASSGMEYPMICFNYGRTEKDGTYTEATKYGMIGVIIHEVGHNFFPMIINSDERQWSWMDEGLNTFVQFLAEQEFDNNFPSSRGPAMKIVPYMKMSKDQLEPIMTNSENIVRFGPNAYVKPATGLNILRETVMGRELFDFAFKQYATRWAFKHPTPADFFRTMEDASGVDLDWFWRGWFYDIDPVDISLDSVKVYKFTNAEKIAVKEIPAQPAVSMRNQPFEHISKTRNKEMGMKFLVDQDTTLQDFYHNFTVTDKEEPKKIDANKKFSVLNEEEFKKLDNNFYYELKFTNKGGMLMPIIIQWTYEDGTKEIEKVGVNVWKLNENTVTKTFIKNKAVASILIDPYKETADIDENNNSWPAVKTESRFEIYKTTRGSRFDKDDENLMQKAKRKKGEN